MFSVHRTTPRPLRSTLLVTGLALVVLGTGLTTSAEASGLYLHRGSRGVSVKVLETRLHAVGLLRAGAVDKRFTRATTKAVRRFQRAHHMRATGRVRAGTWRAIARAAAPEPPPPPPPMPILLAHRGGAIEGNVPENSTSSLQYAVSRGADILEFDLRATSDGQLVLMHDATLDRTTTCTGPVSAINSSDLGTCSLQRPNGQVTTERVPTYEEAADYARAAGKPIAPEIKIDDADLSDDDIATFVGTTQNAGLATRTFLQSFEGTSVFPRVHRLAPALKTIYLTSRGVNPGVVTTAGSPVVAPEYHSLSADWLARYHAAGLRVWTWTVDDVADMQRFWSWGTNGIFTNYPAAARSLLH